jgi:hypothetical protein
MVTEARRKPDGILFGDGDTSVTLHNTGNIFGGEAAAVYVKTSKLEDYLIINLMRYLGGITIQTGTVFKSNISNAAGATIVVSKAAVLALAGGILN